MFGGILLLPQFLQIVRGASPTVAGLEMIPLVLGIMAGSIIAGQTVARTGKYKIFPLVGIVFIVTALLSMSFLVSGTTNWGELEQIGAQQPGVIVVQHPNYLGCLEDLDAARRRAEAKGAILVVAFDPVAAGLLRSPGAYGADVVVGEGQPFGTPLSFGGPYLGLFACKREQVRRLPGRLVGESVDVDGRRAYVTTLRTREQDIRREKASSNVCTNQTLIAVACAVQLAWLGTSGLGELALRCARGTRYAREALLAIDGVEPHNDAPVFREFAVTTPTLGEIVVERMAEEGFLAGIPLGEEYGERGLLISVTERRTRDEIDAFAAAFEKVIR